jgi:sulfur transfer protein SufE
MEREPNHPLNTREFTAKWHDIVEAHVVPSLATVLPRLITGTKSESIRAEQWEVLARELAHALQVAASSSGGVQAAVEYLQQVADTPPGESR